MTPYWHPWHYGGPVWFMTENEAAQRKVTINTKKPEAERPLRNQLFQKVQGTLPEALAARVNALTARVKALAAQALADNMPAIMALHAVECGCRWTPEGPNIFEDERP